MPTHERPPTADALTVLGAGQVELEGRMPWSSNATFLVTVSHEGTPMRAVYKPHRGERALWDFPDGLYLREVAAYEVSEALRWGIVPETVLRLDGPLGTGSFQRFVDADFSQHYFTLLEDERHHDALKRIATFDMLINNADRKSGHCLIDENGRIWAIDNGLCFHEDPKLRTVIWDFAGQPVPDRLVPDLERLAAEPPASLAGLIHDAEIDRLAARARAVARRPVFPAPPDSHRAYPWPMV